MSVQEHCKGVPFKEVSCTKAFQAADSLWPFESWTNEQWNKVITASVKELKNVRRD